MAGRGRRVKGTGSVYPLDGGKRYAYTVSLGWVNGHRDRRTVTARTMRELRPKMAKLDKELEAGLTRDGSVSVASWLTYWLDEIAVHRVRERTLVGYRSYVNTWLIPNVGKHRLDSLTAEHLRSLYRRMEREGKSTATIRQCHAIIGRALRVATIEGKIIRNPADAIDLPKPTARGSHGKLTTVEAVRVLHHLVGDPREARWAVALLAGLRQGEALALPWSHIDLDGGWLTVLDSQARLDGALVRTDVKSKSSRRRVPIIPELAAALRRHAERFGTDGLAFGPRDNKADWKEWQAILAECGIPSRTVHACRATTATLLRDAGVPSTTIAEIMGHARAQVTEDFYIHGDDASRSSAMGELSRFLDTQRALAAAAGLEREGEEPAAQGEPS